METRARALLAPGDVATGLSCRIKPGPESWGPLIVRFQFDRHGARIWKDVKALLDHEHARMRVGAVAVPFGTCAEPSNVSAGGQACPFRFRCLGCGHFRTDPSYLPELRDYLQTLLRNRERILAAASLDAVSYT